MFLLLIMSTVCADCVFARRVLLTIFTVCAHYFLCSPCVIFVLNIFILTVSTVCTARVCADYEYCLCCDCTHHELCSCWCVCAEYVCANRESVCANHESVCANHVSICANHESVCANRESVCVRCVYRLCQLLFVPVPSYVCYHMLWMAEVCHIHSVPLISISCGA
jgi:hypothetical protein